MTSFIHGTLGQRVILDAGRARAAGRGGRAPQGHAATLIATAGRGPLDESPMACDLRYSDVRQLVPVADARLAK